MGLVSAIADRALNRTARPAPPAVTPEIATFHAALPVVDLLVGTVLFRRTFLTPAGHGHVDLPRARAGGLDLAGFSIATRFPDRRGTLSTPHFRSLGLPPAALGSDTAITEAFLDRLAAWAAGSGGGLRLVDSAAELTEVGRDGVVRAFVGLQGGQVLDGDLRRVAWLRRRGVRMLALAHVMDSPLAGSGTGRGAGGLTGFGREAVAELEREGIVVDLAHASPATIRQTVPLLRRPFVVSHTGFTALAGGSSRIRRYSPARRNLSDADARLVGEAGGLIGVTLAGPLVGGHGLPGLVRAFGHAVELVGPDRVALGSDFDGALPMPFDVASLPALTGALLAAGFGRDAVGGIMGGNALRQLSIAWSLPSTGGGTAS